MQALKETDEEQVHFRDETGVVIGCFNELETNPKASSGLRLPMTFHIT